MPSKNEKTDAAEEQAQNPKQITKTQIVFGDPALAAIITADEINRLHHELKEAFRTGIEKAIRIGELLTKQKAQCAHGEWLPWLKANVKFSFKTAYNYEGIYRERSNFVNVTNLAEGYRLLKHINSGSGPVAQVDGGATNSPPTRPPTRMPQYIKVHLRNAPDRDEFAKLMGQEIYDHTREIDFPKVEDVVIDLAPVLDHNNQLLAEARAQWIQFCESHPFHPPVKLAQTQMAMLLAIYRLSQDIAPSLPLPAEAQTMSPRRGSGQKIGGESAGKAPRPGGGKKKSGVTKKGLAAG